LIARREIRLRAAANAPARLLAGDSARRESARIFVRAASRALLLRRRANRVRCVMNDDAQRVLRQARFELRGRILIPRRRARRPTLARALREARKAGVNVAGATIEDGKVSLTFGEAQPEPTNDHDKWLAKRHAH